MAAPLAAVKTAVSKAASSSSNLFVPKNKTNAAAVVQDVVKCRWWMGCMDSVIESSRFLVDGKGKLCREDLHENSWIAQEMKHKYADTGLLHIRNTGLQDMNDQRLLAQLVMGEQTDYEGGANPRDRLANLGNVYDIGAPLGKIISILYSVCKTCKNTVSNHVSKTISTVVPQTLSAASHSSYHFRGPFALPSRNDVQDP